MEGPHRHEEETNMADKQERELEKLPNLELNKETVQDLSESEADNVVGGGARCTGMKSCAFNEQTEYLG
jgi:hypothetical protein